MPRYENVDEGYLDQRQLKSGAAGWVLLAGLGVAYVISGDFAGWNFGLEQGGWGGLLIATILMGLMYTCMVFALAEMSSAMPTSGGGYTFARRAMGPWGGFLTGTAILIEYAIAPAAIVVFIGGYVESLDILGITTGWPLYLFFYALFIGVHLIGVGEALKVMFAITAIAVVALIVFVLGMIPEFSASNLTDIKPDMSKSGASDFLPFGYAGALSALVYGIWFFLAVEGVPLAAEEARDPKKDMPKGIIVAMAILLVFAALMLTLAPGGAGSQTIMSSDNPLPLAADTALGDGSFIGEFVNYAGLAGLIASFFSIIFAYSRQLFALSRAGYFPRALSVTSGRRVPHIALIVPGVIGFLLAAITEDGARMIQIAVFGATVSYVLMLLSHIILRRKEPDLERPYTTPGGTVTSGVGLVLAIAAVIAVFTVDEKAAFITLGVYLAGSAVLRAVLPPPPRRAGARGGVRSARAGRVGAGGVVTLDELKALAQKGDVDTVVLAICDMQGRLMGKRLTARHFLDEVAEHGAEGCNYLLAVDVDMNTVEGYEMASWSRGYGDFVLKPDMDTLRPLPWLPGTVMLMADVAWEDGSDVVASPRQILRRQLARLAERGWDAVAGTELEFIVFRDTYEEAWHKAYRDLEPANLYNVDYSLLGTTRVEPLLRAIRNHMEAAGMQVEDSKGECNLGQHEINFRYGPALRKADEHSIYKNAAKEIASQQGCAITYMAKFDEREGSSCHIHFSLLSAEDGAPVFAGDQALFERFVAGQLACLRELTLFFAPNINSYKRFAAGLVRPHGGRVGQGQPDVLDPRRRPRRRPALREPPAGGRRQPLPGDRGDDRRRAARHRRRARARAAGRGQRVRGRQAARAEDPAGGARAVRGQRGRARGVRARGGRPLPQHGRRRARSLPCRRDRLGALPRVRAAVTRETLQVDRARDGGGARGDPAGGRRGGRRRGRAREGRLSGRGARSRRPTAPSSCTGSRTRSRRRSRSSRCSRRATRASRSPTRAARWAWCSTRFATTRARRSGCSATRSPSAAGRRSRCASRSASSR